MSSTLLNKLVILIEKKNEITVRSSHILVLHVIYIANVFNHSFKSVLTKTGFLNVGIMTLCAR